MDLVLVGTTGRPSLHSLRRNREEFYAQSPFDILSGNCRFIRIGSHTLARIKLWLKRASLI